MKILVNREDPTVSVVDESSEGFSVYLKVTLSQLLTNQMGRVTFHLKTLI